MNNRLLENDTLAAAIRSLMLPNCKGPHSVRLYTKNYYTKKIIYTKEVYHKNWLSRLLLYNRVLGYFPMYIMAPPAGTRSRRVRFVFFHADSILDHLGVAWWPITLVMTKIVRYDIFARKIALVKLMLHSVLASDSGQHIRRRVDEMYNTKLA